MNVIIRGMKEREEYIQYLNTHLTTASWVFDTEKNAMKTFLASMKLADNTPTLHMEDDIILTTNFLEKASKIIFQKPHEVIQFFSMRKDDLIIGSRYDYGRNFMMNQCFYLPKDYSKMIYKFYEDWDAKIKHPTGYDILIADFLKKRKEKYWIHVPSLVQHRQCKNQQATSYKTNKP